MKSERAAIMVQEESAGEQQEVVFYAWTDAGTQSMPSCLTMRISGGTRVRDEKGNIVSLGYLEVRFNKGMLRTNNPEVIAEIRKTIKQGDTITEDKDKYLAMVEPAERRQERLAMKSTQLTKELETKEEEIRRLKEQIAAKG